MVMTCKFVEIFLSRDGLFVGSDGFEPAEGADCPPGEEEQ